MAAKMTQSLPSGPSEAPSQEGQVLQGYKVYVYIYMVGLYRVVLGVFWGYIGVKYGEVYRDYI